MQFVVFEKFTSAYLFQIAWEKSFDYLLIIYKWQFLSCFSIFSWQMKSQATSTLLDENLTCEFKRKNSFTLSKSCMKTERFLYCRWKAVFIHIWIQEPDQKAKENFPVVLMPSLKLFFEWLKKHFVPCSSLSWRRNSSLEQVALTKMLRKKAKVYQKNGFS